MTRAIQNAAFIPRHRPGQEVVARLAVRQRIDVGGDQPFLGIGDEGVIVNRVEGLLLVGFAHQLAGVARRMDRLAGRQHDAGGVFRRDGRIVSELGERRGDYALRHALVGDAGDVIDAHSLAAFRHEKIFAAKLQAPGDAGGVGIGFVEHPVPFLVRPIPVRIGVFVQIAADDGLWFVIFRHLDGLDAAVAADPGVEADEVDEIGALQQKLRHDGVVVVLLGHMTVGAGFGFRLAHGVGEMRREGLA